MKAEQTVDELIENYKGEFQFMDGHQVADLVMERLERKDYKKVIPYPYREMNEVLSGIFPSSFVVIGSDYGGGKSDLIGEIAMTACLKGKRVLLFDFENDDGDFFERQVCKDVSRATGRPFTVADMRMLDIDTDSRAHDVTMAIGRVADKTKDIRMYKNDIIPNINEFIDRLKLIKDVDLVCIDHLHYFEFDAQENSADQISTIMRELRRLTKIERIPVVLVSHLTKREKKKLPTGSDFHGSSNIAKEAKTCILLHRGEDINTMIIDKNREGGKMIKIEYEYNLGKGKMEFRERQAGF